MKGAALLRQAVLEVIGTWANDLGCRLMPKMADGRSSRWALQVMQIHPTIAMHAATFHCDWTEVNLLITVPAVLVEWPGSPGGSFEKKEKLPPNSVLLKGLTFYPGVTYD